MRLTPIQAAIEFLRADQKARDLPHPNAASLSSLRLEDGSMHTREQLADVLVDEQQRMEQLSQELGDVHEGLREANERLALADQQYAGVVMALAEMTQQRDLQALMLKGIQGSLDLLKASENLLRIQKQVQS